MKVSQMPSHGIGSLDATLPEAIYAKFKTFTLEILSKQSESVWFRKVS